MGTRHSGGASRVPVELPRLGVGTHRRAARRHGGGLSGLLNPFKVRPGHGSAPPGKPRTKKQLERAYDRDKHDGVDWPYRKLFISIFWGDFGKYVIKPKLRDFSQYPLSSVQPRRDLEAEYPVELGQRWVFERVLSLGWTPRAFAKFDQHQVGHQTDHSSEHKAERFGKKYQWIALRELAARIADNFHMTDFFDDQPVTYAGPWQFFGRDIDPTLPPPARKHNEDGEFELSPTFASDEKAWWTPPGPSYRRDDPPVGEDWAVASDDIPEFENKESKSKNRN